MVPFLGGIVIGSMSDSFYQYINGYCSDVLTYVMLNTGYSLNKWNAVSVNSFFSGHHSCVLV